jgi:peptidoglycan hydrolase CwlO-like protein
MKSKFIFALVMLAVILIAVPVWSGSDETAADTDDEERFSFDNAMERLKQIESALESFRKLTELSEKKLDKTALSKIDNTGWEIQNLGFPNWGGDIEGTLRKQHYLIQKLEFELAEILFKAGKLTQKELDKKKQAFKAAQEGFQKYSDSASVAD